MRGLNYTTTEVELLEQLRKQYREDWAKIRQVFNQKTSSKRSIGSLQSKYYQKSRTKTTKVHSTCLN
jgi:hypothetical protein